MTVQPAEDSVLQMLQDAYPSDILNAPKGRGSSATLPTPDIRTVKYLAKISDTPWANSLCLTALVTTAAGLDAATVYSIVHTLHPRFKALFQTLQLNTMDDWDVAAYLPTYLRGELLSDDSLHTRYEFGKEYGTAARRLRLWYDSLSPECQSQYAVYLLPFADNCNVYDYIKSRDIGEEQQRKRKIETGALVPHFAALRAEAHFRVNRITRLRQAMQAAMEQVLPDRSNLPLSFSYEEGGNLEQGIPAQERLEFRLWDRRTFVFAHSDRYANSVVDYARLRYGPFNDVQNTIFVEYVDAIRLQDNAPPEGLWFTELLKQDVLGANIRYGSAEEIEQKRKFLDQWGYAADKIPELPRPFYPHIPGLLGWDLSSGNGQFLSAAQQKTGVIAIPVESLYAGSMFGLLAINIFTTTGMRVNEAMQIQLSGDCLVRTSTPAPPAAQDQSPRIRYALRLIPKGQRSDQPSNYYVGQETLRVMTRVAQMLIEEYGLIGDDSLPSVPYDPYHSRSHRFDPAPYLFQYKHRHLGDTAIAACMRFLLHGMSFITRDGQQVIIKPHLLRHAFATHAVQVEEIPIDIVGAMLQQKNVDVTKYYSQATDTMVAEAADTYLSRIAAHVDVGEVMLRLPQELQQLYTEASGRAGTLTDVIGGQCVSHGYCVAKFACVGCVGKVPDPRKRAQVEHKKKWAAEQIEFATAEGLLPAAERMKQLVRDCEAELVEMDQIEAYRQDETRVPVLKLEPQQSPGGSTYTQIYVCS